MSKVIRPPFTWPTLIHDFNAGTVRTHDTSQRRFYKKVKEKECPKDSVYRVIKIRAYASVLVSM